MATPSRPADGPVPRAIPCKCSDAMPTKLVLVRRLPVRPFWIILILACGADRIVSVPADSVSRTVSVAVGQELRITLGNVGPARYESPPKISAPALIILVDD